jgi:serine/threonine-protein kinase
VFVASEGRLQVKACGTVADGLRDTPHVSDTPETQAPEARKSLRMSECGRCRSKNFIPGDLPQFATIDCSKCGHPVMLPVLMKQFELRSIIASGGMGTVFRAFDVKLERLVALKMVKREMVSDAEVMKSFYREARAGAALNHTNIIHIYTFDEFDGQPYLVMELADHGSFSGWIEREGRVPELNVLDVGIKIASALETALKHDLLHRDLKPSNILYNADAEPKLSDFGLAEKATGQSGADDSVFGTPEYVAPEKIQRAPETFLSDMYSLAATCYHGLTGRTPFVAESVEDMIMAHVEQPLTPPNHLVEVQQMTSDAIYKAMSKNPEHRFRSYGEMILELEAARSHLLVALYSTPPEAQGA